MALIFTYLLFLAQIEGTSARGDFIQPGPPESETTTVAGNCATHRVSASYTTMTYGTSVLDSVTIGRKAIPKVELDKINAAIVGNEIARLRWMACPISRSKDSTFKFLLQLNRPGYGLEQRFRPFEINMSGEVKSTR